MRTILVALSLPVLLLAVEGRAAEGEFRVFDGFDGKLALKWEQLHPDPSHVSLTKHPGALTITTQLGGIFGDAKNDPVFEGVDLRNLYLIPNPAPEGGDFVATTCLRSFSPKMIYQQAGLLVYNDDDNYIKLSLEYSRRTPSGLAFACTLETNQRPTLRYVEAAPDLKQFWLRITKRGKSYQYAYSVDGEAYTEIGESIWGDGAPQKIGLIAKNGGRHEASDVDAPFDFLEVRSLTPAEMP